MFISERMMYGGYNSLLQGNTNTRVYLGIIDGDTDYVGIAYDIKRRQARAIEQAMIKNHPEFSNKINSISTKRDWCNDAITWLKEHGYLK